jgi:hypothetical protein
MHPGTSQVAEALGYAVLIADGRRVAVPPGGLQWGAGAVEFSVVVEDVSDLVESREIVGRIGDRRVHVPLPPAERTPERGEHVLVHAKRCSDLPDTAVRADPRRAL